MLKLTSIHRPRVRGGFVFVVCLLIALSIGPLVVSRFMSNVGLLALNRSLAQSSVFGEAGHADPNLATAERWLRSATDWDAGNRGAWRGLGFDLAMQARADEANNAWRTAGMMGQEFIQRGETARLVRQYAEALAWYERAEKVDPGLLGSVLYFRFLTRRSQGHLDSAFDNLHRAITVDRGWIDPGIRFRAWYEWGVWLTDQHRDVEAEDALLTAIAAHPNEPVLEPTLSETYRFLGLAQWSQNKLDRAVYSLSMAVRSNPQNVWAHIHYGKVLYLSDARRVLEVEDEFRAALDLAPNDAAIWKNLMEYWRWVGQADRARALCGQTVSNPALSELSEMCTAQ